MRPTRLLVVLLCSCALHLLVLAPSFLAWRRATLEDAQDARDVDLSDADLSDSEDEEGELPIEPLADTPFRVSIYAEPAPVVRAHAEPRKPDARPGEPLVDLPIPVALPLPAEVAIAAPAPEPVPEPPPVEPIPEPVLTDADRAALAEIEQGEETEGTPVEDLDDEYVDEVMTENRRVGRSMRRARARTERHPRRDPCPEQSYSIARVSQAAWYVDRDLIEYYATHMAELQKLGWVYTHRDKVTNEPDGFRVSLKRCSVLREGGLRTGDIVHDINGRRINNVLQAIGAYFALRKEPELSVRITRRNQTIVLAYTIEQPLRGKERRAARRAQANR